MEDAEAAHAVVNDGADESDGEVLAIEVPWDVVEEFL